MGGCTGRDATKTSDGIVARMNVDGTMDATFGDNGIARIDMAGGSDYLSDAFVDGPSIYAVGGATPANGGRHLLALVRLGANGALDAAFGNGGKVLTPEASSLERDRIAVTSGAKIVIAGASAVVQVLPSGVLDTAFGAGGIRPISMGQGPRALLVMANGRIRVGTDEGTVILTPGGAREPGYFLPVAPIQLRSATWIWGVGQDRSSLGTGKAPITSERYVAATGARDETYGGTLLSPASLPVDSAFFPIDAASDAQERLVVLLRSNDPVGFDLVRANADFRSLDTSFGKNGHAVRGKAGFEPKSVAISADGRILVASKERFVARFFP